MDSQSPMSQFQSTSILTHHHVITLAVPNSWAPLPSKRQQTPSNLLLLLSPLEHAEGKPYLIGLTVSIMYFFPNPQVLTDFPKWPPPSLDNYLRLCVPKHLGLVPGGALTLHTSQSPPWWLPESRIPLHGGLGWGTLLKAQALPYLGWLDPKGTSKSYNKCLM